MNDVILDDYLKTPKQMIEEIVEVGKKAGLTNDWFCRKIIRNGDTDNKISCKEGSEFDLKKYWVLEEYYSKKNIWEII